MKKSFAFLVLFMLILMGCNTSGTITSTNEATVVTDSVSNPSSPILPNSIISPVPTVSSVQPQAFVFDRPNKPGQTILSGSGVPNAPIVLYDITMNGQVLGSTTIDADGRFEVGLATPLQTGHRIGLGLGDLSGTPFTQKDFAFPEFNGPEARNIPQVGFFFDTLMVNE